MPGLAQCPAGRLYGESYPAGGQGDPYPGALGMWFVLLALCSLLWKVLEHFRRELSLLALCPSLGWSLKGV